MLVTPGGVSICRKRRASGDSDSSDTQMQTASAAKSDDMNTAHSPSRQSSVNSFHNFASSNRTKHEGMLGTEGGGVKKIRRDQSKAFPISKLLATMDKQELLTLLNNLIDTHPDLQSEIEASIPRPTLQSVTSVIVGLEKKMNDSFPYSKSGPGKDNYSFNRVRPALAELVEAILSYATHFTSSEEFPTTTFSFLHVATTVAHRLPEWDTPSNNEMKRELYQKLAHFWRAAIQDAASKLSEGKIYGQQVVGEWARNLAHHNNESQNAFAAAVEEFTNSLGWIIGIYPPQASQTFPKGLFSSNDRDYASRGYLRVETD
ncbi:hypothetical protein BZG36_02203 [Bifiguratus adelaidae]|uniref:Tethering factor for nuclear proteasome STS1 n=1 Tax=Bifiguratus adelaidae TaxID=1938954 RepID=A0A261Y3M4_9FUNG|nr:hypothetical protein BZG36_02203 [Bifiguratus adelaidae]